jgi:hypothetical protein
MMEDLSLSTGHEIQLLQIWFDFLGKHLSTDGKVNLK